MTHNLTNRSQLPLFFGLQAVENDSGFRKEILKLSSQGMMVAGILGILGIIAYVFAKSFFVNANVSWTYRNIDPETTVVLWDKLIILLLSIACVVLAKTKTGPRFGRLLMASMVIVFSISSMLDDVIIGQGYTPTFLVLFMSIAVGTMPYRGWQTFLFGLTVIGVITLSVQFLPLIVNVPYLKMQKTVYVFLGIMTIIYTGISGLLYSSRFQQYRARKKAEDLKKQLEITHESLQGSYKKLSEAQDQLVQAQKIAAMARVTAGIAHEIKNPLNFVNNFSEIIADQAIELKEELEPLMPTMSPDLLANIEDLVENLRLNAGRIHKHGERANEILAQMLDHSTSKERVSRKTNVSKLLAQYVHLSSLNLKTEAPDLAIEIEQNLAQDIEEVEMVPKEMGQVIMNLMSNAFESIQLKASSLNGSYQPRISVFSKQVNDRVEIRIKDNGIGVSEDIKSKIFEPFFTTTRKTGLGLSLAHDIVTQRHNGLLKFEADEDGATFVIALPKLGTEAL